MIPRNSNPNARLTSLKTSLEKYTTQVEKIKSTANKNLLLQESLQPLINNATNNLEHVTKQLNTMTKDITDIRSAKNYQKKIKLLIHFKNTEEHCNTSLGQINNVISMAHGIISSTVAAQQAKAASNRNTQTIKTTKNPPLNFPKYAPVKEDKALDKALKNEMNNLDEMCKLYEEIDSLPETPPDNTFKSTSRILQITGTPDTTHNSKQLYLDAEFLETMETFNKENQINELKDDLIRTKTSINKFNYQNTQPLDKTAEINAIKKIITKLEKNIDSTSFESDYTSCRDLLKTLKQTVSKANIPLIQDSLQNEISSLTSKGPRSS